MSPTELFPKGNLVRVELILSASESLSSTVSHRVVMHVQAGQVEFVLSASDSARAPLFPIEFLPKFKLARVKLLLSASESA